MDILNLVKLRLGITSTKRDEYLNAIIKGIQGEIKNIQGIELDVNIAEDVMFIVDYACYRYESKGEYEEMPRHLQWRLHNLAISKG